jgi:hypothetical protein
MRKRFCRPSQLPLMTCLLKLAIARRVDLRLSAGEPIVRRHITDGAVQTHCVVVIHVGLNQAQRIFSGQR